MVNKRELLNILRKQTQFAEEGDTYFTFTHLLPIVEFINEEEQLITEQELADIALENGYGILNVFPEETYPTGLVAYPVEMKDPETQLLLWYADMYGIIPTIESYNNIQENFSFKDIGPLDTFEGILLLGLEERFGTTHYPPIEESERYLITPNGLFIGKNTWRGILPRIKTILRDYKDDFMTLSSEEFDEEGWIKQLDNEHSMFDIEDSLNDYCIEVDTTNTYEFYLTFPRFENLTDRQIEQLPTVVKNLKERAPGELVVMNTPAQKVLDVDLDKGPTELVAIAKQYKDIGVFDDVNNNIQTLKEYKNGILREDFNIVDYTAGDDAFLEFIETVSMPELNRGVYQDPVYITPQGNFILYYLNSHNHKMLITSGGSGEVTISSEFENDVNFDIEDREHLYEVFIENCIVIERVNEGIGIYLPKPQNLTDTQINAFINSVGIMDTFSATWESYDRARGLLTHNKGWVNIIAKPYENSPYKFQSLVIKQAEVMDWEEVLKQLEKIMKDYRKTRSIYNQEPLEEAKADTDRFKEWAGDALYNMFVQFKNRLKGQERDIYYWMNKKYGQHELYGKLSELEDIQTRKQYREKAKEGAETIYKDTTWEVLKITSIEASCLYGKNTMWCISGENAGDYFDPEGGEYYYFFINKKTRKKYAVEYTPNKKYVAGYVPENLVSPTIWGDTDNVLPYIKDAPIVQGLPNLNKPPRELVDNISRLGIHVKDIYGYEDIIEMGVLSDEELFDIPHEMGSPGGSVIMVNDGNSYSFIFLDGDYANITDITEEINKMIEERDMEESVEGNPAKNELKKMADKHKKANKRKGRGWWENPNAGNVKHNIDIFNHMMGANTGPHPLSQGYAETSGEGMGESLQEEFELTEKIEKHDTLNPKLWEGMELKPEVKERALLVVDDFVEELKEDGVVLPIKDILIIGSNASYNYSETSDLDLHIIYDEKELECPTEVYPLLYSAYRSIYNKKHPIDFYGVGVEIYVEDGSTGMQLTKLNGVYSLNKGWIKEPSIDFVPDVESLDLDRINSEFNKWEDKYFAIINEREDIDIPFEEDLTLDEEKQLEDIINYIEDIYILRRSSIKTEGEYGIGNLVFKEIRSMGYLDTLKELKSELKAKALSLE